MLSALCAVAARVSVRQCSYVRYMHVLDDMYMHELYMYVLCRVYVCDNELVCVRYRHKIVFWCALGVT